MSRVMLILVIALSGICLLSPWVRSATVAPNLLAQAAKEPVNESTREMSREVDRIMERIEKKEDRAWTYAYALRALAGDDRDKASNLASLLLPWLDKDHPRVRLVAAQTILALGEDQGDAVDVLVELVAHDDESVVEVAAQLLLRFVPDDPAKAAKAVRQALSAREYKRAATSVALAAADATLSSDDLGIERLRSYLARPDRDLANRASLALAQLGKAQEVRGRLDALARESGELGMLARALIQIETASADIASWRTAGTARTKPGLAEEVIRNIYANYIDAHFDHGQETLDLTVQNLVDQTGRSMVASLDPFCEFLTAADYRKRDEEARGNFVGIGAFVGKEEHDPAVRVSQPIYSGPAYKAGLRSGDYLWEVEVSGSQKRSLVGLEIEDVVKLLRGEVGTPIRMWVKRPGVDGLVQIDFKRDRVHVDTALETLLPGNIGYLRLKSFGEESPADMAHAMSVLEAEHKLRGLVIDLRDNPGGLLEAVLRILEMYLPRNAPLAYAKGIYERYKDGAEFSSKREPRWPKLPLVLLVDGQSASGSELLSGTLQAHKRALVIGEKTFGKGVGQGFYPVFTGDLKTEASKDTGRILKCTVFAYYIMPGMLSIDRHRGAGGVSPDIEVAAPLLSSWEFYELAKLRDSEKIERWVRETWSKHKDVYMALADFDRYDPQAYPDFDTLYKQLATPLSKERIRSELRTAVRIVSGDERAQAYHGNYEIDYQLQRAVIALARQANIDLSAFPEYRHFLDKHK